MSDSHFIYYLCSNINHSASEGNPDTMEYDNNFIAMWSPHVGLFKTLYIPKYLGFELEGISRVHSISGMNSGFVLTDIKGNVYTLNTDDRIISDGNILESRDLLSGVNPYVTFGGTGNELNYISGSGNYDVTIGNSTKTVSMSYPLQIQTIHMITTGEGSNSFAQSRNFRNIISAFSLAGYTGVCRQVANQIIVCFNTGFCGLDMTYSVDENGIAKFSAYHFYNNTHLNYYHKAYQSGVSGSDYSDVAIDFETNAIPEIIEILTENYRNINSVPDSYSMFIVNTGKAYSYPRYSQSAIFTIPLNYRNFDI